MSIRFCQNSFSRGVLSPSLQGRVDLEQYSTGLKTLENGIILQEGCVLNRSGLEYVTETKCNDKKSKLIPFVFGLEQNYIIELGNYYIRFIKNGSYILDSTNNIFEISSPYNEDEVFEIDYSQQADVITLVHKNHPIQLLSRYSHNNWTLTSLDINPKISPPQGLSAIYSGASDTNTREYSYVVCSVDNDTNEESSRSVSVGVVAHKEAYWTTSEYVTISWQAVQNACEYNVYKSTNGIFAYIGTTTNTSFIDNNIEADLTSCAPIYNNPFVNNYPSVVCSYQQRKVYANSSNYPQRIWASQTASDCNFNISRPLNSTDAIDLTLQENVASQIQYLLPFKDLLIMTTNSEWIANGQDGVFCANPSPIANLQSLYGASKIKPIVSGSMVVFVQSGGNIVRDLGYNYLTDSYDGEELSLFASHLFEGRKIIDMAYAKEPYRIIWCVMDDGTINAITYNPQQKIYAWHTHNTQGKFESVACIREDNEDICYFVIKRIINNAEVRFIERFKPRNYKTLNDSFLLDCAIKQTFDNEVNSISGLNHLKNQNVTLLLDGGVVDNLTVDSNGALKLPYGAKNVLVGLPYVFKLETLNIESQNTFGYKKIINEIGIKILNSSEDFFILNDDDTLSENYRCLDSINNPDLLFTKNVSFCPLSNSKSEKNITVVQKYPLPLNILSVSCDISVENVEEQ